MKLFLFIVTGLMITACQTTKQKSYTVGKVGPYTCVADSKQDIRWCERTPLTYINPETGHIEVNMPESEK